MIYKLRTVVIFLIVWKTTLYFLLEDDINHADDHARHNGFGDDGKGFSFQNYFTTTPSVLEIRNGKVIFKNKIGEGHYGTVHLGEVRYNSPNNAREYVAIKTLKSVRAPQLSDDFMREIEIMEVTSHNI